MGKNEPSFELMKPFKITGIWWFPGRPENKIGGELSFCHEDGLQLTLFNVPSNAHEGLPRREIILGLSSEAKEITLVNCRCYQGQTHHAIATSEFNSISTETYWIETLLHGICIESKDQVVFSKISIDFPLFFEWLNTKPFEVSFEDDMKKAIITINNSDILNINVNNEFSIRIPPGGGWKQDGLRQFVAYEHYHLVIQSSQDHDLEKILEVGSIMQNFLSLATGVPIYPVTVTAYRATEDHGREMEISVVYNLPRWAMNSRRVSASEMLFTRMDFKDEIDEVIKSWFKLESNLKMVYGALFSNVFNPNLYPENEFINIIQGLESYHRTKMNNLVEPRAVYREKKNRIHSALGSSMEEEWRWLEQRLNHANEPSLSLRLTEVFYAFKEFIPFLTDEKIKWLIDSAVEARNRMMHPEEGRSIALSGAELVLINLILKIMVKGILLFETNVRLTKIPIMIKRTKDYQNAKIIADRYML